MLIIVSPFVRIPFSELELSYARSSGPGGQNVNKVNSKAVLRWSVLNSPSLREDLRQRLLKRLASRLTVGGEIVLSSDRFRDQTRNRDDCLEKLKELVAAALIVPKIRKPTAPTRGSQRRDQVAKKHKAQKKSLRRSIRDD